MKRRFKYGNKKARSAFFKELAGRRFDSRLERDRAEQLTLLQKAKEIRNLQFQVTVYITRARISYKADFYYEERIAPRKFRKVYEDSKGIEGRRWNIIKKLWKYYGPALLRVTKRNDKGGISTVQEIIPE